MKRQTRQIFPSPASLRRLAAASTLALLLAGPSAAQTPPRGPDFNFDGFDDVAIGSGQEDWGALNDAGMVNLGYGSATGLEVPPGHSGYLTQTSPGLDDTAEKGDLFGSALAWGDFDGDCFDDLAIGSFLEDIGGIENAGAIHVVYGSGVGLDGADSQFLHRDVPGVDGSLVEKGWFGSTLAAGDFDADGYDDLAVASGNEVVGGMAGAGTVQIFYGSPTGLSLSDDVILTRSGLGLDAAHAFGRTLASGDFDCDGRDDLAIGTPFADPDGVPNGGDVAVLYGSGGGLVPGSVQRFYQGHAGVGGANEGFDYFGGALASGNFNGDLSGGRQCLDLAIGIPAEDWTHIFDSGAVQVLYGTPGAGLQATSPNDRIFTQDTPGIDDTAEANDGFGYALVTGRFNDDVFDDLAIGVRNENGNGAVALLRGGASGLSASGDVLWSQATPGISDIPEANDAFGHALGYARRTTWDGSTLLVGVPWEGSELGYQVGLVHDLTLDSHLSSGLVLFDEDPLGQATFGGSSAEALDRFGEYMLAPRHVEFRCPQ